MARSQVSFLFVSGLVYLPVFAIQPVSSIGHNTHSKGGFLPVISQSSEHLHNPSHGPLRENVNLCDSVMAWASCIVPVNSKQ